MDQRWLQVADRLKDLAYDEARPGHVEVPFLGRMQANHFNLDSFGGFVCEADNAVLVAFRGSCISAKSPELLERTVRNWLANFCFAQTERSGYKVHKGFTDELSPYMYSLKEMIRDLGGGTKPVCVVGHSAGGAIATLGGRFLQEDGIDVREVFAFSSPRVGDRQFADTYPVTLRRVEHKHDLVPHVPLAPFMANLQDALIESLREAIEDWLDVSAEHLMSRNVQYIHAGELYYDDGKDLIYRVKRGEYFERIVALSLEGIKNWLGEKKSDFEEAAQRIMGCPEYALPMPAVPMDIGRAISTATAIKEQLFAGKCDFVRVDHSFSRTGELLKRLAGKVA